MRIFSCLLILIALLSCKKTPLVSVSDDFEGTWVHYVRPGDYHKVIIEANGTGTMEWYVDDQVNRSTKEREWFLEDNVLSHGKASFNGDQYEVDKYPTVAWEEIIEFYDTIPELGWYMILDEFYYRKVE